jgi:hypothetical protein
MGIGADHGTKDLQTADRGQVQQDHIWTELSHPLQGGGCIGGGVERGDPRFAVEEAGQSLSGQAHVVDEEHPFGGQPWLRRWQQGCCVMPVLGWCRC